MNRRIIEMNSKTKWDRKHQKRLAQMQEFSPNVRLKDMSPYLKGGVALDLACGLGANSLFLARSHYEVQALDISEVAIKFIEEQSILHSLPINAHVCDLTNENLSLYKQGLFDLIVITYYLDRSLFPIVKSLVKEGGYFFMETFFISPQQTNQTISDQYKLLPNELLSEFNDWHILYYEENELEERQTIFCRRKNNI